MNSALGVSKLTCRSAIQVMPFSPMHCRKLDGLISCAAQSARRLARVLHVRTGGAPSLSCNTVPVPVKPPVLFAGDLSIRWAVLHTPQGPSCLALNAKPRGLFGSLRCRLAEAQANLEGAKI